MIAKFQFYLDGTLVTDPKGWEDLDTTFKRDQALFGLLISQEAQLEFFDNGHTLIKNKLDNQNFCSFVEIEIKQTCDQLNYERIFKGVIFLSECQFFLEPCSVKVKTIDDGFYARINRNKSIKFKLDVGRSKNDVAINPASAFNNGTGRAIQFFDPFNGVYGAAPHCYTAYEVLAFLVDAMSDGQVGFVSTIFGAGGTWEGQCITSGNEVLLQDQSFIPELDYQTVFTELNKKNRLGFAVELISGKPTLRIEEAEYFYTQTSAVTLADAKEVTMQMDTSQLYANVHLGSSITDDTPTLRFPEDINFIGFKDETLHVVGDCNVDTTLDLASSWIISSNVIEQIFVNADSSHLKDIVLVDVDLNTNKAVQLNWLLPGTFPVFYNEIFNNSNVVEKWFKGIPNQIALFLGSKDNTFLATLTANQPSVVNTFIIGSKSDVHHFDDDFTAPNYDTNLNYDNVLSKYTAPSPGVYSFETRAIVRVVPTVTTGTSTVISLYFRRFDFANTVIKDYGFAQKNINKGVLVDLTLNANINLNATDYVIVRVVCSNFGSGPTTFTILKDGYFKCTGTVDGGGQIGSSDPSFYKIKKYTFKYPLTFQDYKTIKADPKKLITFTTNNGITQTGWIDNLKYYHHNKPADITLITN